MSKQSIDKKASLSVFKCMLLARLTEERLIRLYHQGQIFGGVYTGVGQEAIGSATTIASAPDDLFAPCIRNMTVHIGRGESVLNIFRQYLGRVTGPMRGRDGNVHYGSLENGVYPMISHLGAMLPVLVGGVMAKRMQGYDSIGVAYIGDGATSTGDFHEAVNFAAVKDVPVIFLIENNKFAYSTPISTQFRCESLVDRAVGYGIEGVKADGNDAVKLYELSKSLMDKIRNKPQPIILECDTMRMRGHGEHDDFSYVPKELLKKYAERDPLDLIQKYLAKTQGVSEKAISELRDECQQVVDQSYRQALSEPVPDASTLMDGVYANG